MRLCSFEHVHIWKEGSFIKISKASVIQKKKKNLRRAVNNVRNKVITYLSRNISAILTFQTQFISLETY